jgi:hypothetical protein
MAMIAVSPESNRTVYSSPARRIVDVQPAFESDETRYDLNAALAILIVQGVLTGGS